MIHVSSLNPPKSNKNSPVSHVRSPSIKSPTISLGHHIFWLCGEGIYLLTEKKKENSNLSLLILIPFPRGEHPPDRLREWRQVLWGSVDRSQQQQRNASTRQRRAA